VDFNALTNIVGRWSMSDNVTSHHGPEHKYSVGRPGNWANSLCLRQLCCNSCDRNFTNQPLYSAAAYVVLIFQHHFRNIKYWFGLITYYKFSLSEIFQVHGQEMHAYYKRRFTNINSWRILHSDGTSGHVS